MLQSFINRLQTHVSKHRHFKIPVWIKILISIALLWLIFRQINPQEIKLALKLLPPWLLFLLSTSSLYYLFINSIRWAILIPLPLSRAILHRLTAASYLSAFYSLFLPSSLGGDVIKWGLSFGTEAPKSRLASSIIMDRVIGLVAASLLSFTALLYLPSVPTEITRVVQLLTAGVAMMVIIWIVAMMFPKLVSNLPIPKRFLDLILLFQTSPKSLIVTTTISVINQLLVIGLTFLAFSAVDAGLTYPELVMITSLTAIFASLPISFGGFGTTELSLVYLTNLLGANQPAVLAVVAISIPLRLINTALAGIAGWGLQHRLPH